MQRFLLVLISVLFFSGCAGHKYYYYMEPTPLKKEVTKYSLGEVKVNLILGHGAIPGDNKFASESVLNQEFYDFIKKNMEEKGILASEKGENTPEVNIVVNYIRKFNYGGKALNKPDVSHDVTVFQNGNKLARFGKDHYTTAYGFLEDTAVTLEIAAFTWDEEDEPRDVALISSLIVKDLAGLGQ
ncbi:hypothetical protein VA7868_02634 [Vibrio aerogenes CECT 7868]|uniref:Lipoprotein n=1 Tax=Vibrio aerogenes CECT 7868 TaxID=1216006 RepID=A0A1M5ZFM2_9VIBR|nr:hypothetical protein [Vibrio aerogenes]SHI22683.1 hypothetical protein VA7868_02634 [Vibrio aerogenes CECT 7868]